MPADAELSRHDPDVPDWESLSGRRTPALRPDDGGVRRVPDPHRSPHRPAARLPPQDRRARQHADHGGVGQRRQCRGRRDRHDQRGAVLQQRPGAGRGQPRGHRRDRRTEALQPLPVGLDLGRQHAVPSLEARDLPRRRPPTRSSCTGRTASRRGARSGRSTRTSSTWCPTVLDLLGLEAPATIRGVTQSPIQGVSFAHTLDDATAPSTHHTQYFEMLGHRAIYHDGWRAVCPWPGPSFAEAGVGFGAADLGRHADASSTRPAGSSTTSRRTSPRTTTSPRSTATGSSRMIGTWYVEAGKYDVMPVDGSGLARMIGEKPLVAAPRDRYVYGPDTQSVPYFAAPRVLNRPHSITADVEIPEGGAEGVLLCQGTAAGGYSLFIQDGQLHYVHNYVGRASTSGVVGRPGPARAPRAALRVRADRRAATWRTGKGAPGRLQLYVDGALVGEDRGAGHDPVMFNPGALTCGANPGSPVTPDYTRPFRVHRHHPHGDGRRQRRAHRRPRGRAAGAHGPPVVPAPSQSTVSGREGRPVIHLSVFVTPRTGRRRAAAPCGDLLGWHTSLLGASTEDDLVSVVAQVEPDAADAVIDALSAFGLPSRDVTFWRVPSIHPLGWRRGHATTDPDSQVWAEVVSRADDNSQLIVLYVLFMIAAGVVAGVGVLTGSSILVVGAMALSPDLLPISASVIGIVERRWQLAARATRALCIGLAIGAMASCAATAGRVLFNRIPKTSSSPRRSSDPHSPSSGPEACWWRSPPAWPAWSRSSELLGSGRCRHLRHHHPRRCLRRRGASRRSRRPDVGGTARLGDERRADHPGQHRYPLAGAVESAAPSGPRRRHRRPELLIGVASDTLPYRARLIRTKEYRNCC